MRGELPALTAVIIGEKQEAFRADTLQQHDTRRRMSVLADGGQRHRRWLRKLGFHCLAKPALELDDRICVDVGFGERGAMVLAPQVGGVHCGCRRPRLPPLSVIWLLPGETSPPSTCDAAIAGPPVPRSGPARAATPKARPATAARAKTSSNESASWSGCKASAIHSRQRNT